MINFRIYFHYQSNFTYKMNNREKNDNLFKLFMHFMKFKRKIPGKMKTEWNTYEIIFL